VVLTEQADKLSDQNTQHHGNPLNIPGPSFCLEDRVVGAGRTKSRPPPEFEDVTLFKSQVGMRGCGDELPTQTNQKGGN
jgi:hypothetical protein